LKKNNNIKKISNYAMVGGLGAILVSGLVGCEDKSNNQEDFQNSAAFANASQKQAAFVVIEESQDGRYAIVDEFPSSKTTIVLRRPDGTERILTKTEIDALVKAEEVKIDNGTSGLTNPDAAEVSNGGGGMGLGGVLMSSIAGAMIGSYIGNKLFNNQNYQNQRKAQYKSPSTYSKSKSSFSKAASTSKRSSASKKSGFFGNKSSTTKRRSSFFGG
jgi:type II secretory pathway pseudopilin PulG